MRTYDRYNSLIHNGYLPVRVLEYNFIDWFLNITPDFVTEYQYEVDANNLKKAITNNIEKKAIYNIAELKTTTKVNEKDNVLVKINEIEVYENFSQFLWAFSYSLLVIFDEGIQKPTLAGTFTGNFLDTSNAYINKALGLFKSGANLFQIYREGVFYRLPNPEKYNEYDKFYIERANGIYTAAMTFILLHEFGHQHYGHPDTYSDDEQSKKDEILVDEFAFEKMETQFSTEKGYTLKCGIIVGLTSIMFLDDTLKGGDRHPDPDNRLRNLITKMNLPDLDNIWAIASLPFNLWAIHYNKSLKYEKSVENYKELFDETIIQLYKLKGNS